MKETIKNLAAAYVGESQARNRYTYYAKVARLEGYRKISEIFIATAEQERTHAKRLFEHLNNLTKKEGLEEDLLLDKALVPHIYDNTKANLQAAIEGEKYENSEMYPEFAQKADAEGYPEIANRMRAIAKAEKHHQERFQKLLDLVGHGNYFERSEEKTWACLECGYIQIGKNAPSKCPSCDHSQAHYEVQCEEF